MLTVAVSGINAVDNPGPGTGVARCLKESGLDIRVVGFVYDAYEPGIYMDWLIDKAYLLPYPSSDSTMFLNRLLDINSREKIDMIIPVLDVEIPVYLRIGSELENAGIKTIIPERKSFQERNKDKLFFLAERIGLKSPLTKIIQDCGQALENCTNVGFPCMIKGPFYEAVKVSCFDEMNKTIHELASRWGFPIIVQEFIQGDEYNCAAVGDGNEIIGMVAVKKVAVTKLGKAWTMVSVDNEAIFEAARLFTRIVSWQGAFELELILDKKTNKFYLIEINPRFPAWIYMSKACGINLPERLVSMAVDLPFKTHSKYPAGKLMIRYTSEMIKDIGNIEEFILKAEN